MYSFLRLILLSYLVLPQTQGAKRIYQSYIHPFLARHEHDIDKFIISAHGHAKSAGLMYLKHAIEFLKENLLGIHPKATPASPNKYEGNYAQNLLSRFNLPSARQGLAAPAGDFYGLLSAALGTGNSTTSAAREAQLSDSSRSGTLIPLGMTSASEKMSFLSTQRERLQVLLSALDKEASDISTEAHIERDVDKRLTGAQLGDGLRKSKSEAEFEEIGTDEPGSPQGKSSPKAGWMPWTWGSKAGEQDKGLSSGTDVGT